MKLEKVPYSLYSFTKKNSRKKTSTLKKFDSKIEGRATRRLLSATEHTAWLGAHAPGALQPRASGTTGAAASSFRGLGAGGRAGVLALPSFRSHEQSDGRRSGRAWWSRGDGGRRQGRGPDDAECQRVGHFCGATATCLRKHGDLWGLICACPCSLHRLRKALILGSPCSPLVSGAFSRTGGARACTQRPWRMLGFGGSAVFRGRPVVHAGSKTC